MRERKVSLRWSWNCVSSFCVCLVTESVSVPGCPSQHLRFHQTGCICWLGEERLYSGDITALADSSWIQLVLYSWDRGIWVLGPWDTVLFYVGLTGGMVIAKQSDWICLCRLLVQSSQFVLGQTKMNNWETIKTRFMSLNLLRHAHAHVCVCVCARLHLSTVP